MLSSGCRIIHPQTNAAQQKFCQNSLSAHAAAAEKVACRRSLAPRLEQPSLIEKYQRFVQVNQRRPDQILILDEHFFGLCK